MRIGTACSLNIDNERGATSGYLWPKAMTYGVMDARVLAYKRSVHPIIRLCKYSLTISDLGTGVYIILSNVADDDSRPATSLLELLRSDRRYRFFGSDVRKSTA